MADQDLDFEFDNQNVRSSSTKKSSGGGSSRRRRDLIENENQDDLLESTFDMNLSSSIRKPQPQPRKSNRSREDQFDSQPDSLNQTSGNHVSNANKAPASRAINGWSSEELSNVNVGQSFQARSHRREPGTGASTDFSAEPVQQPTKQTAKKVNQREINNDDLEIPEIPDLEEPTEPSDDIAFQVAEAPDVQVHQILTYKEFHKEFFKEKAFQFLEGNIDVSLLHCGLNTEQQIAEEEDVIWEWTKLFTEVVSILSSSNENEPNEETIESISGFNDTIRNRQDPLLSQLKREKDKDFIF